MGSSDIKMRTRNANARRGVAELLGTVDEQEFYVSAASNNVHELADLKPNTRVADSRDKESFTPAPKIYVGQSFSHLGAAFPVQSGAHNAYFDDVTTSDRRFTLEYVLVGWPNRVNCQHPRAFSTKCARPNLNEL